VTSLRADVRGRPAAPMGAFHRSRKPAAVLAALVDILKASSGAHFQRAHDMRPVRAGHGLSSEPRPPRGYCDCDDCCCAIRCSARSANCSYSAATFSIICFERGSAMCSATVRASTARARQCAGSSRCRQGIAGEIETLRQGGHSCPFASELQYSSVGCTSPLVTYRHFGHSFAGSFDLRPAQGLVDPSAAGSACGRLTGDARREEAGCST
jgi:hypothetical protein